MARKRSTTSVKARAKARTDRRAKPRQSVARTNARVSARARDGVFEVGGVKFNSYAAGKVTRSDPDFMGTNLGVNVTADMYLAMVKARSRQMADDNPIVDGLLNTIANNAVGSMGLYPQAATGDAELDAQINDLVHGSMDGVDAGREISLAESQSQFIRELGCGGEVLTNTPIVDAFRGHERGPAIELIDGDLIPLTLTGELDSADHVTGILRGAGAFTGGKPFIRQGVQFDAMGRRVGYHVYKVHPNDGFLGVGLAGPFIDPESMRMLPAQQAVLGFRPRRLGQVRGVPWIVSTTSVAREEDAFREAFLALARVAASLSAFVTGYTPPPGAANNGLVGERRADSPFRDIGGTPYDRLDPGMIGLLPPGADIKIMSANLPPPTFASTVELMHRRMAAGMGVSYAVLARDYSKATFSATRAESLEDRKGYRVIQMRRIWTEHTGPWYRAKIDWALLSGRLKISREFAARMAVNRRVIYKCNVVTPGWEWVNPQQEASAAEIELRIGSGTLAQICGQKGESWRQVLDQRCDEEAYWDQTRKAKGLEAAPLPYEKSANGGAPGQNASGNTDPNVDPETGDAKDDAPSTQESEDAVAAAAQALGVGRDFASRFAHVPLHELSHAVGGGGNGHARGKRTRR